MGTSQTGSSGGLLSAFFSALASAKGNVFDNGQHVTAYATGGVVNSPTFFPMRRGIGLMGEAGPEAIMPLKRGPDGKLGVVADVSRARGDTNINVTVPVQGHVDYRTRLQVGQATGRVVRNATRNS
jgi:lambda family phage tail tape measure protein